MEIKIKADNETSLLLTNEHLDNDNLIELVVVKDGKIKEDITIDLIEIFIALKALVTIKEQ